VKASRRKQPLAPHLQQQHQQQHLQQHQDPHPIGAVGLKATQGPLHMHDIRQHLSILSIPSILSILSTRPIPTTPIPILATTRRTTLPSILATQLAPTRSILIPIPTPTTPAPLLLAPGLEHRQPGRPLLAGVHLQDI